VSVARLSVCFVFSQGLRLKNGLECLPKRKVQRDYRAVYVLFHF
jgi:hypothetical protein